MSNKKPDLTKNPPRSARVRLGGFAILPRMIDKGRATIAGTNGEYNYDCPLDQRFVAFAGIDPVKMKELLAAGKGDGEILQWVREASTTKPSEHEIAAWTAFEERRVPGKPDVRAFFHDFHSKLAPHRDDIETWFDLLDLDDYASFGGMA